MLIDWTGTGHVGKSEQLIYQWMKQNCADSFQLSDHEHASVSEIQQQWINKWKEYLVQAGDWMVSVPLLKGERQTHIVRIKNGSATHIKVLR